MMISLVPAFKHGQQPRKLPAWVWVGYCSTSRKLVKHTSKYASHKGVGSQSTCGVQRIRVNLIQDKIFSLARFNRSAGLCSGSHVHPPIGPTYEECKDTSEE